MHSFFGLIILLILVFIKKCQVRHLGFFFVSIWSWLF